MFRAEHPATAAAKTCVVPSVGNTTLKQATAKLRNAGCGKPKVSRTYSSVVAKGLVINTRPAARKKAAAGKVKLVVSNGRNPKLCVVKRKNASGKLVVVYQTKIVKVKVRKKGKLVTVKKRVFVYQYVKKGRKRVKVKVPKLGPCGKNQQSTSSGIPVKITVVEPDSVATIDFGAFQRQIPLSGGLQGFIAGKAFQLGKDNQINLTKGHIGLGQTGIFIDDVCNGQISDSIRVDSASFTELDPGAASNAVNVAASGKVTGLLHMRVQTSLQMRNDDQGCTQPYFTTGWTDFTVPLFIKGKLGAEPSRGLVSTIDVGETVLNDLSACLAPGPPTLPCNGFAIPFPGILTAHLVTTVKVG